MTVCEIAVDLWMILTSSKLYQDREKVSVTVVSPFVMRSVSHFLVNTY